MNKNTKIKLLLFLFLILFIVFEINNISNTFNNNVFDYISNYNNRNDYLVYQLNYEFNCKLESGFVSENVSKNDNNYYTNTNSIRNSVINSVRNSVNSGVICLPEPVVERLEISNIHVNESRMLQLGQFSSNQEIANFNKVWRDVSNLHVRENAVEKFGEEQTREMDRYKDLAWYEAKKKYVISKFYPNFYEIYNNMSEDEKRRIIYYFISHPEEIDRFNLAVEKIYELISKQCKNSDELAEIKDRIHFIYNYEGHYCIYIKLDDGRCIAATFSHLSSHYDINISDFKKKDKEFFSEIYPASKVSDVDFKGNKRPQFILEPVILNDKKILVTDVNNKHIIKYFKDRSVLENITNHILNNPPVRIEQIVLDLIKNFLKKKEIEL